MQLVIGGNRLLDVDPLKDTFSLLIRPDETMLNQVNSSLGEQEKYLFHQLTDNTIILAGFTYLLTNEEEDQDK
jgi:hypothetical protein